MHRTGGRLPCPSCVKIYYSTLLIAQVNNRLISSTPTWCMYGFSIKGVSLPLRSTGIVQAPCLRQILPVKRQYLDPCRSCIYRTPISTRGYIYQVYVFPKTKQILKNKNHIICCRKNGDLILSKEVWKMFHGGPSLLDD